MIINPIGFDPIQDHVPLQAVIIDGPVIQQLDRQYKESGGIADEEWDAVVTTAARVLSRCPESKGPFRKVTGLALGKVQSGKTLSYTALIALAIDNGYRITVVLAGTKKPLLEQTYARLDHDLDAQRIILTSFENPNTQDAEVVHSIIHGGGHALLVAVKNRKRIDDITQLLSTPELRNSPVLIIDDEGDEASLNTQFRRGRRSSTYASILNLRDSLPLHAYIAYTATPQANLLLSGLDGLSPDFAELIEPGSGYCGGAIFFGENNNRYLRTVSILPGSVEQAGQITSDHQFAIALFFVGGAIRWLRGDKAPHSMLLHTSNLKVDHALLQESAQNLITLWKQISSLPTSDPSNESWCTLMHRAYKDLCKTVVSPPQWKVVIDRLKDEIWQTEVWMVNSLPLGRDPIAMPFRLKNNILIGGNMLGRGVTLKGLAVTYITREAKKDTNADTLEQRARWFGYKRSYLDVCRIFLTDRLLGRYSESLLHEDDFWEALRRNQKQGISVRDWPRMFRLDMDTWELRPTRSQVADFRQFRSEGWYIQRKLIADALISTQNLNAVKRFFERHTGESRKFGNVEHLIIPDLDPDILISDLLSQMDLKESDWEKSYVEEYLTRLRLGNRLQGVDILLMNKGIFRKREARDGQLVNPMEGPSSFYPGDRNIHADKVQIQVHLVRPHGTNNIPSPETTILALYIPDNPQYDLRAVVRGDS